MSAIPDSAARAAADRLREYEWRPTPIVRADEPDVDAELIDRFIVPGGDAILDEPDEVPAIWGTGSDVLWAEGEPCLIVAPPGVGKTTIAQQVVLGLIGIRERVLNQPVREADRVLYLAMDRPRQITRSFRRMVTSEHREVLNERLLIRRGPPPADLATDETLLVQLAGRAGADVIVVDSLKDAAVKLTDDETGGRVNRAMQYAISHGIDVLVLHHQRKAQNGEKPKTLNDVYGSTWIAAGAGSVILLWGSAGDPVVEMIHLKQPVDVVGPWKIEHDHVIGVSKVTEGFDPLVLLRNRPDGITVRNAAVAMTGKSTPTESDQTKARRKLDALCAKGLAVKDDAVVGGPGGSKPAVYRVA